MDDIQKAAKLLREHNQQKILKKLEKNKNQDLVKQILSIDFDQIEDLKEKIGKEEIYENHKIEKISYIDIEKLSEEDKEKYYNIGKNIISQGKYAVITMAGGQRNKTWT